MGPWKDIPGYLLIIGGILLVSFCDGKNVIDTEKSEILDDDDDEPKSGSKNGLSEEAKILLVIGVVVTILTIVAIFMCRFIRRQQEPNNHIIDEIVRNAVHESEYATTIIVTTHRRPIRNIDYDPTPGYASQVSGHKLNPITEAPPPSYYEITRMESGFHNQPQPPTRSQKP